MAIFTAIATALLAGTFLAGTIAVPIVAGVIGLAASYGLSYAAKALSGNQAQQATDHFSVQGTIQAGGIVPRSFNLGYSVTAGSLVYANTWGPASGTPNAFITQVIALSDLPGGTLVEVWVNGELCTLDTGAAPDQRGYPVIEYRKGGSDYLWVKYYDGTQTTADPLLVGLVSSAERPYESTRVGTGIAYVTTTALVEDTLFTGIPTFRFAVSGVPLYDPSKDSTNGGSGSQRYSNPATWGGDGDNLPVVQIYNLLRGFRYGGTWLYGLQNLTAARLPAVNWVAQIAACRATITGPDGAEPIYRSGGQINVNAQLANAVEAILSACQGRLSEVGGFYKIHAGAPGSPTFSWTDADLLSTDTQVYRPFFALSDSVNGVQATYPDPAQGWNTATAPAYYRTDLEIIDGNRRLMANPSFDFVPYAAQVQRLQKSHVEEAQRARTHVLPFPPAYWLVEPGDIGSWTSARNGYVNKSFRVDGVVDGALLDVILSVTEVDPADYDWNHGTDFQHPYIGPTTFPRPAPQGIVDWYAEPWSITDADGIRRRPAIRLSWDGSLPGVSGVAFSVRNKSDQVVVHRGRTDFMSAGAIIISQNLLPNFLYQAQGQYIPSWPRDVTPSDWLDVTTPNDLVGLVEFDAGVAQRVTDAIDDLYNTQKNIEAQLAALGSINAARNWLDKKVTRSELSSVSGAANARITEVFTVATNLEASLAQTELELTTSIGAANARIDVTNTSLSDLSSATAAQITTLNANFGSLSASLSSEIVTRSSADNALSARIDSFSAQTDNSFAAVNSYILAQTSSINSLAGQVTTFGTTLDGQSAQLSIISSSVDGQKVQFGVTGTIDGITGGFVFSGVRRLDGAISYGLAIRGDVIVDGTLSGTKIQAGTIDAIKITAGSINATQLAVGGVAIQNLIAGSATRRYVVNHSGGTGFNGFGTQTCEILSGTATCTASGEFNTTASTAYLQLIVDGTIIKQFLYGSTASGTYSWDVTGLSVGNHTFQWQVHPTDVSKAATANPGQASVQDLRR
jgi:hypothetical protein